MRSLLLLAAVAGMMESTQQLLLPSHAAAGNPHRIYTSADDERKAMAQAKRDRKAAKRAAQQGATQ